MFGTLIKSLLILLLVYFALNIVVLFVLMYDAFHKWVPVMPGLGPGNGVSDFHVVAHSTHLYHSYVGLDVLLWLQIAVFVILTLVVVITGINRRELAQMNDEEASSSDERKPLLA